MSATSDVIRRGVIAGFLGATTVVIWTLILDTVQGRPLYTPNFIAAALFGITPAAVGTGSIIALTAIHYTVFFAVGLAASAGLRRIDGVPGILLGLVLGFLFFDLMFYSSVAVTGVDIVGTLGWVRVLIGSVAAGIVLMAYLDLSRAVRSRTWLDAIRQHPVVREGAITGLIGAAIVAGWFLIVDLLTRQVFFTPAALGSALLYGARGVEEVTISAPTVIAYTFIHIAAFLAVGLIATALLTSAEREPRILLGAVLLFVTFEVLFLGLAAIAASWLLDALGWWNIVVANFLAAGGMGGYLWRRHPALGRALRHASLERPA